MKNGNVIELDVYRAQFQDKLASLQTENFEDLGSAIQHLIRRLRDNNPIEQVC